MDVLQREEGVRLRRMFAHGGLFKTKGVAQRYLAAAIDTPVSVGTAAAEGGAWGIAVLASYSVLEGRSLELDVFLDREVFAATTMDTIEPSRRTSRVSRRTSSASWRHAPSRWPRRTGPRRTAGSRTGRPGTIGAHDDLLAVALDVTDPRAAEAAVRRGLDRFGRVDVLVNNAGSFYAGFFEEMSPQDFRAQIETTLFGPVNVTRAVLPVMRAQRSGLVVTISSTAGIAAEGDFLTAYAASKFGVEGWMEALAPEVAPYGVRTMLVEPGFFRTELLTPQSTNYAAPSIEDYAERTQGTIDAWQGMDGQQGGDPAKLAAALVQLAGLDEPPLRFAAGADAVETFERKARTLLAQADAHRELSSALALDLS